MTKKEQIIHAASALIAKEGRANVSTASIAQQAGVSEGLIFRHFKNKNGLMVQLQEEMINYIENYCRSSEKSDAAQSIQSIMEWPFHFSKDDRDNWSLILFSLQDQSFEYNTLFAPVNKLLRNKLKELNVANHDTEAELIVSYLIGFATTVLRNKEVNANQLLTSLQKRYAA